MITDHIQNAALYENAYPGFAEAFAFLRQCLDHVPENGRYPLDGDRVFANVMNACTSPAAERGWEAHRKYIDIQFVVDGREKIGHADVSALLDAGEYDAGKDILLAPDASDAGYALLTPGRFAVLFPHEAHQPGCEADEPCTYRKIVVKVRVREEGT